MNSRLLYVTHVDWGHVRQRPHHLAAGLAAHFDVTVAFPLGRLRSQVVANPHPGIRLAPLIRPPGSYRSTTMFRAGNAAAAMQLRLILARHSPGVIIVSAPECYAWMGQSRSAASLGYDCMDDALAFTQDRDVRDLKAAYERALLARADLVTCTTETLLRRCTERGAPPAKCTVIPNGWDPQAFPVQPSRRLPAHGPVAMGYFGTIADWLDFESLEALVTEFPDTRIRLIGPNLCGYVSPHPRLTVEAPVEHARLLAKVQDLDLLLLPFRLTDLIRAVEPVKLYEYIALGRPIMAVRYPELQHFASFVTFYQDKADLLRWFRERAGNIAQASAVGQREALLCEATWSKRAGDLATLIENVRAGSDGRVAAEFRP